LRKRGWSPARASPPGRHESPSHVAKPATTRGERHDIW
jgi:hypothetical protein